MAREYEIRSEEDFDEVVQIFKNYFKGRIAKGLKFLPIRIIAKRLVGKKTSKQHRTYWYCIGQLKKAFQEQGDYMNEEDIHNLIKVKSGFTKICRGVMIPLSISDKSDDATIKDLNFLIEFMLGFAAIELGYEISIDSDAIG